LILWNTWGANIQSDLSLSILDSQSATSVGDSWNVIEIFLTRAKATELWLELSELGRLSPPPFQSQIVDIGHSCGVVQLQQDCDSLFGLQKRLQSQICCQ